MQADLLCFEPFYKLFAFDFQNSAERARSGFVGDKADFAFELGLEQIAVVFRHDRCRYQVCIVADAHVRFPVDRPKDKSTRGAFLCMRRIFGEMRRCISDEQFILAQETQSRQRSLDHIGDDLLCLRLGRHLRHDIRARATIGFDLYPGIFRLEAFGQFLVRASGQ